MYLSGKITNSFFAFLNRCEFNTSCFFDMTDLEIDFLKDPHSWMDATQVELLLNNINRAYESQFIDKGLVTTVGHNSIDLNCWGGLEDFLKLFHNYHEIYDKLHIFFSYFIKPAVEIHDQEKTQSYYSFTMNLDGEDLPNVRDYFRAILEILPVFLGGDKTEVEWIGDRVKIYYGEEETLFLPLEEFQNSSNRFLDGNILLEQIDSCEKHLLNFKKKGSSDSLDQSLKIIKDLKKTLGDEQ